MSDHHPHIDTASLEHTFTKKAGPLPVWAWGLGIGAVLVVFLWLHNRDTATGPVTAYDDGSTMDGQDSDLAGSNAYDSGYGAGFTAGGGGNGGSDGTSDPTDATDTNPDGTAPGKAHTGPRNNASWLRRASAYLVSTGNANPLRASRILNRYLAGDKLNHKQRQVVNQAIKGTGLPPSVPQNVSTHTHTQHPTQHATADHHVQPHVSNTGPSGAKPRPPKHLHHAAGVR